MTNEELQPFFNISLNSGALPRVLGEKLTEEEYALLSERVQAAIEAAYDAGVDAERKRAVGLCEERRKRVLNDPRDPSWTEHFAELANAIRA